MNCSSDASASLDCRVRMKVAEQNEELARMETITEGIMILALIWQIHTRDILAQHNEELLYKTGTISLATQIKRRWSCLGALVSNVIRQTAQDRIAQDIGEERLIKRWSHKEQNQTGCRLARTTLSCRSLICQWARRRLSKK